MPCEDLTVFSKDILAIITPMQVSSETLFHFTTSFKNLQNILSKKFHLTYCNEKCTLKNETHDSYFPMISFCDIPLSLAKDQISKYGSYAIGMTKEWGIKNQLNPVVYIEKDSLLGNDIQNSWDDTYSLMKIILTIVNKSSDILQILGLADYPGKVANLIKEFKEMANSTKELKDYNQLKSLAKEIESIKSLIQNLEMHATIFSEYSESLMQQKVVLRNIANSKINFFRYIKNYQGTLIRKNNTNRTYRFYDEREWRYVPAIDDKRVNAWLDETQYKDYRGNSKIKPLIDSVTLNFTSDV